VLALAFALVWLFLTGVPGLASETGLSGREGHPRGRLPLALHLAPLGEPSLDEAAARAIEDWRTVSRETLGVEAFARVATPGEAQVTILLEPAPSAGLMGVTRLGADAGGVIALPVRIALFSPAARGQTSRETVVYQVVAHELGHALGLAHTGDPRSLMCCVPGSVDFGDPVRREAYVEGRRRPDVRSVAGQLAEHYRVFWGRPPTS
jgi:hypothetical protein